MPTIIASDLHLVCTKNEEYRWGVFSAIKDAVVKHGATRLLLLGDYTDYKDRHPAELLNKFVAELRGLTAIVDIDVLCGNHDFTVDPKNAFLKCVDEMQAVRWIDTITEDTIEGMDTLWLPFSRQPNLDWKDIDFSKYQLVLMHQTVVGSKASDSYECTSGLDPAVFSALNGKVLAGDIHVPQKVGKVEYIGAPTRLRYGDSYTPRIVLLDGQEIITIATDCALKHKLEINCGEVLPTFTKGDMVKVVVNLTSVDYGEWAEEKTRITSEFAKQCVYVESIAARRKVRSRIKKTTQGITVTSFTDVLKRYAEKEQLSEELVDVGREIALNKQESADV